MTMEAVIIDDKIVSSELFTVCFACDYAVCGGYCCIAGDAGAPLAADEPAEIESAWPEISGYMSAPGREAVGRKGFFEIDADGDMVTPLSPYKGECAYACIDDDGSCRCAIEKAYFAGRTEFRKPVSCQLYPVRVTKLTGGMTALNLHRWNICECAFAKGGRERIPAFRFLKDALCRAFGEGFYKDLEAAYSSLDCLRSSIAAE